MQLEPICICFKAYSLYDRISKCLINNKKYNEAAFPKEIRRYIPLNYNARDTFSKKKRSTGLSSEALILQVQR